MCYATIFYVVRYALAASRYHSYFLGKKWRETAKTKTHILSDREKKPDPIKQSIIRLQQPWFTPLTATSLRHLVCYTCPNHFGTNTTNFGSPRVTKKPYIRIQYRIPSCIPHHKEHPQNTMPFTYLHYLRRFNIFTHTHCTCCDHGSEFLHEGVINRLEELLNRERRGRKRDRIRKFVRSRNFIRPSNFVKSFVKSLRRKKKGKGPRRERPDRKRDWSQRFIGFLRRKKSGEVEIPLQARGADGA